MSAGGGAAGGAGDDEDYERDAKRARTGESPWDDAEQAAAETADKFFSTVFKPDTLSFLTTGDQLKMLQLSKANRVLDVPQTERTKASLVSRVDRLMAGQRFGTRGATILHLLIRRGEVGRIRALLFDGHGGPSRESKLLVNTKSFQMNLARLNFGETPLDLILQAPSYARMATQRDDYLSILRLVLGAGAQVDFTFFKKIAFERGDDVAFLQQAFQAMLDAAEGFHQELNSRYDFQRGGRVLLDSTLFCHLLQKSFVKTDASLKKLLELGADPRVVTSDTTTFPEHLPLIVERFLFAEVSATEAPRMLRTLMTASRNPTTLRMLPISPQMIAYLGFANSNFETRHSLLQTMLLGYPEGYNVSDVFQFLCTMGLTMPRFRFTAPELDLIANSGKTLWTADTVGRLLQAVGYQREDDVTAIMLENHQDILDACIRCPRFTVTPGTLFSLARGWTGMGVSLARLLAKPEWWADVWTRTEVVAGVPVNVLESAVRPEILRELLDAAPAELVNRTTTLNYFLRAKQSGSVRVFLASEKVTSETVSAAEVLPTGQSTLRELFQSPKSTPAFIVRNLGRVSSAFAPNNFSSSFIVTLQARLPELQSYIASLDGEAASDLYDQLFETWDLKLERFVNEEEENIFAGLLAAFSEDLILSVEDHILFTFHPRQWKFLPPRVVALLRGQPRSWDGDAASGIPPGEETAAEYWARKDAA